MLVGRYMKEEEEEEAVRFVTQQSKPENDTATGSAARRGNNMDKDSARCGCCFCGFVTLFAFVVVHTYIHRCKQLVKRVVLTVDDALYKSSS